MARTTGPIRRLFSAVAVPERARVGAILRTETVGGLLVIAAAVVALVWANSPAASSYEHLREFEIGPDGWHLRLSLGAWAADGLLAIFFFVAGLELKREFVSGDLADVRRAVLPIGAAIGGMVVPAGLYVLINHLDQSQGGELRGWAVPIATDIAFAVAVLALISTHLPSGLRTFLLTLAVVDDLLAITVIAIFYTDDLRIGYLVAALLPLVAFGALAQRRIATGWLLIPLAFATWWCVHQSGVHATVAGVLLAFTVPVLGRSAYSEDGLASYLEHRIRPVSSGFAVPVFAFMAAGVSFGGVKGLADGVRDPLALGVIVGLVLGKPIGITLSTWVLARFTRAELDSDLDWIDLIGVAALGGIGFTVSLLIGHLAFGEGHRADLTTTGVLLGSVTSAAVATVILRARNRTYRRITELSEE